MSRRKEREVRQHVWPAADGSGYHFDVEAMEGADSVVELRFDCQKCGRRMMTASADPIGWTIRPDAGRDEYQRNPDVELFQPMLTYPNHPGLSFPADGAFAALGGVIAIQCHKCARDGIQIAWARHRGVLLEMWMDAELRTASRTRSVRC